MLTSSEALLCAAREGGYAVGGFAVWNLESVRATVAAAETEQSSLILHIHAAMLHFGGAPFVALCMEAARTATVPVAVHHDWSSSSDDIRRALDAGIASIMVDGSHLPYERSLRFTRNLASLAHERGALVEAVLGRTTTAERVSVERPTALLDPADAATFVEQTGVDVLAIGVNDLGRFDGDEWQLDLVRLAQMRAAVAVPLVVLGASSLPDRMVRIATELGVAKFDVHAELEVAYLDAIHDHLHGTPEPLPLMDRGFDALYTVVTAKLHLFGSAGRAIGYSPLT